MAKLTAHPRSYQEALAILNGKDSKKLGNNTYLEHLDPSSLDVIAVRLHATHVVKFWKDGQITLHTGGWRTVTTKDRINEFIPGRVYQKDHEWFYVHAADGSLDWQHPVEFHEGLNVGKREPDFHVDNQGSIVLLRPLSSDAQEWVNQHIPDDAQYFGNAVCIEPRYLLPIVDGITLRGLKQAERLHMAGWQIGRVGLFTIQFYRRVIARNGASR